MYTLIAALWIFVGFISYLLMLSYNKCRKYSSPLPLNLRTKEVLAIIFLGIFSFIAVASEIISFELNRYLED